MTELVEMPPVLPDNEHIVEVLRDLLQKAEEGQVYGIAYVAVVPGGTDVLDIGWARDSALASLRIMLAGCTELQADLIGGINRERPWCEDEQDER